MWNSFLWVVGLNGNFSSCLLFTYKQCIFIKCFVAFKDLVYYHLDPFMNWS